MPNVIDNSPLIVAHALAALASMGLGAWVLVLRKGTEHHRRTGRVYVAAMVFVSVSSFWIGDALGPIHILSCVTLVSLLMAIVMIRRGNRRSHRGFMIGAYIGLWGAALPAMTTPGRLVASWFGIR